MKLVRDVIRTGQRNNISVSVCGEMAGEPLYTLLLLGLGLTTFSMNGPDIPEVKKIIRSTTYEHAKQVARKVMSRRKVALSEEQEVLLREVFAMTRGSRVDMAPATALRVSADGGEAALARAEAEAIRAFEPIQQA